MTQTFIGTTVAYCDPATFCQFYDWRPFAQLVSDTGLQVYQTAATFQQDAILTTMLLRRSGVIESALLKSDRYTIDDLRALLPPNNISSGSFLFLQGMNADLAAGFMYQRRPEIDMPQGWRDKFNAVVGTPQQEGWLDRLAAGDNIFSFQESADAGVTETRYLTEQELQQKQSIITQARPYFGRRAQDNCNWWSQ